MNKKIHIEFVRIISAFFVIFNHTGAKGFFLFSTCPIGSLQYWIYLFISILCKVAVPLYFMISGALILKRDIPLKELWIKKILPFFIILIFFSLLYFVNNKHYFNLKDFTISLYSGNINYSFWYLYAYLAFLISSPFLRSLVKGLSYNYYIYIVVLCLVFVTILPSLQYITTKGSISLEGNIAPAWVFTNIVCYPLIGYFLENVIDIKLLNLKHITRLLLCSFFLILLASYMTYYKHLIDGSCLEGNSQWFHNRFILIPSMSIYLTAKYVFTNKAVAKFPCNCILFAGNCTFGIYLFHVSILGNIYITKLWNYAFYQTNFNKMIIAFLICTLIMSIGLLMTFLFKSIPGLKKLHI